MSLRREYKSGIRGIDDTLDKDMLLRPKSNTGAQHAPLHRHHLTIAIGCLDVVTSNARVVETCRPFGDALIYKPFSIDLHCIAQRTWIRAATLRTSAMRFSSALDLLGFRTT